MYELIDSGNGRKLERFGSIVLDRPDPQALWPKLLSDSEWQKADAVFDRKWNIKKEDWVIDFQGLKFSLKLLPSKHVGLFPEQAENWKWLEEKINKEKFSVLNLFANTGGATLACAKAGAEVTHVDSSQFVVDWAMKNRDLNDLSDKPIHFITDDVRKFVEREIKRKKTYDIIILDPPIYGKGNKVWKIEEDLMPLLIRLKNLNPKIVLLNGYASIYSHIAYANMLSIFGDNVSSGELTIKSSDKPLPAGIFARWEV